MHVSESCTASHWPQGLEKKRGATDVKAQLEQSSTAAVLLPAADHLQNRTPVQTRLSASEK